MGFHLMRKNKKLEIEVAYLKEALQVQHSHSTVAPIQRTKTETEEKQLFEMHHRVQILFLKNASVHNRILEQIFSLEEKLKQKDAHYETELRQLRQQCMRLKLAARSKGGTDHLASDQTHAIQDLRAKHAKEVRALKAQLERVSTQGCAVLKTPRST